MENSKKNVLEENGAQVHHILAQSYFFFFLALLFGVTLDLILPIKIFQNSSIVSFGFIILILASLLILWAQHTSRNLKKENLTKETFCRGPYCYTRTPTHWGLFLLILGFGITANAFFVVFLTIVSFVITKLIFIKKEEKVLAIKYGAPYLEYKKQVHF